MNFMNMTKPGTKYICDSLIPQASYEVKYRVISDDTVSIQNNSSTKKGDETVRQIIMVVKNPETNDWKFQV
jgi:hypothetical protein